MHNNKIQGDPTKPAYEVWVDGSVRNQRQNDKQAGAGWIWLNHENGKQGRFARSLSDRDSGSSVVTEFNAAAMALASVPEAACIKLHSDCKAVRNYLQKGIRPSMNSSSDKTLEKLDEAIADLDKAAAPHSVFIDERPGKKTGFLRQAHNLARKAALFPANHPGLTHFSP